MRPKFPSRDFAGPSIFKRWEIVRVTLLEPKIRGRVSLLELMSIGQFFSNGNGPGIFQKIEVLLVRVVELIVPELLIAENVDAKEIEGFSDGVIDLCDILDHGCGSFNPRHPFDLQIGLFGKPRP